MPSRNENSKHFSLEEPLLNIHVNIILLRSLRGRRVIGSRFQRWWGVEVVLHFSVQFLLRLLRTLVPAPTAATTTATTTTFTALSPRAAAIRITTRAVLAALTGITVVPVLVRNVSIDVRRRRLSHRGALRRGASGAIRIRDAGFERSLRSRRVVVVSNVDRLTLGKLRVKIFDGVVGLVVCFVDGKGSSSATVALPKDSSDPETTWLGKDGLQSD